MLTVEGLTCRYGKVTAVSDLSLEVHKGEFVTPIGANGAGKTTTPPLPVAFCSLASPIVPRVGASSRS